MSYIPVHSCSRARRGARGVAHSPVPGLFPQRHAGAHAAALRCPRRPLALRASLHRMYPATLRFFCMLHAHYCAPTSHPRAAAARCTSPHAAPRTPTRRRSSAHSSARSRAPAAAAPRHAPRSPRAPRCARAAVSSTASTAARARHSPATRQRPAARAPVGPLCSPMLAPTPQRLPGATAFLRVVTALVGALQPFSAHPPTPLLRAHTHAHSTPCPPAPVCWRPLHCKQHCPTTRPAVHCERATPRAPPLRLPAP
jgi:hypothetical protein